MTSPGPLDGSLMEGGAAMSSLSQVVDVVRARFGHVLDHLEDPQETYAYAQARQREMLSDVRQRLVEIEAEHEQAGSDQARERLADEQHRLRELEQRLLDRIAEFGLVAEAVAAQRGTHSTQADIDRAVVESERLQDEIRHRPDW